jgi:hypothetical protein
MEPPVATALVSVTDPMDGLTNLQKDGQNRKENSPIHAHRNSPSQRVAWRICRKIGKIGRKLARSMRTEIHPPFGRVGSERQLAAGEGCLQRV